MMQNLIDRNVNRFKEVKRRIEHACELSGRTESEVKLVFVTKTIPKETVEKTLLLLVKEGFFQADQIIVGENKVQEAYYKFSNWKNSTSSSQFKKHFIGHLQTNKVNKIVPLVDLIHSVDRWSLIEKLYHFAEMNEQKISILLQVNVSGEKNKFGLAESELLGFMKKVVSMRSIWVKGLMTMAPWAGPDVTAPIFHRLKTLKDRVNQFDNLTIPVKELSMGMSNDFDVAIREGATLVRIGSAIFGDRSQ